jgi:hypothetical protein
MAGNRANLAARFGGVWRSALYPSSSIAPLGCARKQTWLLSLLEDYARRRWMMRRVLLSNVLISEAFLSVLQRLGLSRHAQIRDRRVNPLNGIVTVPRCSLLLFQSKLDDVGMRRLLFSRQADEFHLILYQIVSPYGKRRATTSVCKPYRNPIDTDLPRWLHSLVTRLGLDDSDWPLARDLGVGDFAVSTNHTTER